MKYRARALGSDAELSVEHEGLRIGSRFLDYADVKGLVPMNHRVLVDTLAGERIEISMLGFSYDGFWEELSGCFAARSREALFVEGEPLMAVEGDYATPLGQGRGRILLYPDAACILPLDCGAVRIPLCFTDRIELEGYRIHFSCGGVNYAVGRMGYDTQPFAERAQKAMAQTKREREQLLQAVKPAQPYTQPGLFRTTQPALSWQAAYGPGCCAVELDTGDNAATYLYRFSEPEPVFRFQLALAMEAMGPHREIIWMPDEQLRDKPLYRMALARCSAACFLRDRSAGRIIHTQTHAQRLAAFLSGAAERNDA